jgi:uncharacterized protein YkwD
MIRIILIFIVLIFLNGCGQKKTAEINLESLLSLHNQARSSQNLESLSIDPFLTEYAANHAAWMAKKNTLQHSSINNLLGRFQSSGENIAWNQNDENQVFDAWMRSRPHKANILNQKFNLVGFGMARNSKGQPYWCAVFGK